MAAMVSFTEPAHSQQQVIKWRGQSVWASTVAPYGPFRQGETGLYSNLKYWTEWLYKRTTDALSLNGLNQGRFLRSRSRTGRWLKAWFKLPYFLNYYAGGFLRPTSSRGNLFLGG